MTKTGFVSVALVVLSFATGARAESCAGAICVSKRVIDSYNQVGSVTAIQGDQVTYAVSGYSYVRSASDLSPEVDQYGDLKKSIFIIDSYNQVGQSNAVFADGRVYYTVSGSAYVSSSVFPEVRQFNGIAARSVVIDSYNQIGTVQHIFADGRASYRVSSSLYVSSEIVPAVSSFAGISTKTVVIDSYNQVGVAQYAFKDGRVSYTVSDSLFVSSQVIPEQPLLGKIAAGVLVIDSYNQMGTTLHAFQDGRVQYLVDGRSNVSSAVSAEVAATGSDQDVKKGVTVLDSYNQIGVVAHVFEDQRVNYVVDRSSYISSNVSPEVSNNPKYSKDALYASDSGFIGRPARFFKDGRIQVVAETGEKAIATALYAQVQDLPGYGSGTTVITDLGTQGQVTLLFENGIVQYQYPKIDETTHRAVQARAAGEIFGFNPKMVSSDESEWIRSLAGVLENGEFSIWMAVRVLVVSQSGYPALKAELLQRLNKEPGLIPNADRRAQVSDFLSN